MKKTYLDYEYRLIPYHTKITRIKDGKAQEKIITEYAYTKVDDDMEECKCDICTSQD